MDRTEKEQFVIGAISLLSNKLIQVGDGILPDITFRQWFLLIMMSKMEIDEKNINSIAEFVGTTRQNIKKMLIPLKKNGYVSISQSNQDGRALKVELTEKAYQYFSDNDKATAYESNQLFSLFSDEEVNCFVSNLQKLLHSLEMYRERRGCNE